MTYDIKPLFTCLFAISIYSSKLLLKYQFFCTKFWPSTSKHSIPSIFPQLTAPLTPEVPSLCFKMAFLQPSGEWDSELSSKTYFNSRVALQGHLHTICSITRNRMKTNKYKGLNLDSSREQGPQENSTKDSTTGGKCRKRIRFQDGYIVTYSVSYKNAYSLSYLPYSAEGRKQ